MSDFTDTVADVLSQAADKIREYGEVAKLQTLIKAEEAKKQDYYYKLGKKYYELYKDAPASDLTEITDKLVAADEKIAGYKEDLKAASSNESKYTDVGDSVPTEEPAPQEESAPTQEKSAPVQEESYSTSHFDETV